MFRDSPASSGYSANDVEATKRFYGETLGLELEESMGGVGLKFRNGHTVFGMGAPGARRLGPVT